MSDQVKAEETETSGTENQKQNSEFPYTGIFSPGGLLSTCTGVVQQTTQSQNQNPKQEDCFPTATESDSQQPKQKLETNNSFNRKIRDLPPPNEGVVTIDHILELLFKSLKPRNVLTCRLVCRRWLLFAQAPLQNQLELKFVNKLLVPKLAPKSKKSKVNSKETTITIQESKSLADFVDILQDLRLQIPFPCSKFTIRDTLLQDSDLQEFLTIHGQYIEELTIHFAPRLSYSDRVKLEPHERELMVQVKNLLLHQTPNIRVLRIYLGSDVDWEQSIDVEFGFGGRHNCYILLASDPEFKQIHSEVKNEFNVNLKILQVLGSLSSKVFEVICVLSPNLEEVTFDDNKFNFLLSPINRIHFIKTLFFNLNDKYYYNFSTYEKLVSAIRENSSEKKLQLRALSLHMKEALTNYDFAKDPEMEPRVINVLNQIFESTSNSLEILKWDGVSYLRGFRWPKVMPNVWKIELGNMFDPNPRGYHSIFPKGSSLMEMLPKLRCIKFFKCGRSQGEGSLADFISWLNISEPMPAIQIVYINGICNISERSKFSGKRENRGSSLDNPKQKSFKLHQLKLIYELFPCAQVRLL